jgi:hypothetical protein
MDLLQQYASFLANGGLIPYALRGLDYLRRAILGEPPATSGVSEPYIPPFTGGQCYTSYNVTYSVPRSDGGFLVSGATTVVVGRIVGSYKNGGEYGLETQNTPSGAINRVSFGISAIATGVQIDSLSRVDGSPDNCGDLPNPNPTPSPASDGLAFSEPPDFTSSAVTGIVDGTAAVADGSEEIIDDGLDDFTEAGELAPTNIGGALAKLASGLFKVLELLAILNDILELLKKLTNSGNKSSFSYDFGNLRFDGFIRIQSEPPTSNISPLHLDLQVTAVKVGISRIFGEKSPNYYYREPVGYIHFVSPTFGVLSSHQIRFNRTSIPIPPLAYGFFYNLGLDGTNRANATGFYLKQEE